MKTAKIEITLTKNHYSKSCGRFIPGGYEANVLNPEDFNCGQIYSQLSETKEDAIADIRNQLNCNVDIIG